MSREPGSEDTVREFAKHCGQMKVVRYSEYGGPEVFQMATVPKPIPTDDEVLIRIHATTVSSGDRRLRSMQMPLGFEMMGRLFFGVLRPKNRVLGSEFAGRVEAIGKNVRKFKRGDSVFGLDGLRMGCYAEYRCMKETGAMAIKPANLTYGEAATLSFGGSTAMNFLRRSGLKPGEKVLVNGASGCVGSATVQLAKLYGADVTGVCTQRNAEFVRSLGAHRTIDYTKEDYSRGNQTYDVIVDTIGNVSVSRSLQRLTANGRLLLVAANILDMAAAPIVRATSHMRILAGPAAERIEDIEALGELASKGLLHPTVDAIYHFDEVVDAHRYVDTGRKRGSVVIKIV